MMSYDDYIVEAARETLKDPTLRRGQAYFNVLLDARPDLAEYVRSTILDPFYSDSIIPEFLAYVEGEWSA